ncbi:MAG: PepSY-associated TM helix domain-containing protein [Pseudomonadota bacterium]
MASEGFQGAFRQSMAWLHTWSGLVLSLLLYFIFITGSFGYFNLEVDQWMQPEQPNAQAPEDPVALSQLALSYLEREVPEGTRYFIDLPGARDGGAVRVYADLPEPGSDGESYLNRYLDPATGAPVTARETGGGDALYAMHYALHYMPYEVAIYIVGVGTLFMFLALITGIVTHKKIFADFFTLRLRKGQRSWLDGHNVSSVLALPFMLMITYSGLVFYTFEYSPGVMLTTMGIDKPAQQEMYTHLYPGYGESEAADESATMVAIAQPLADAQRRWPGAAFRYVELEHPGDTNAVYWIGREAQGLERGGDALRYSAATGEFLGESGSMPADSAFSSGLLAIHEGHFASYLLRWLFFLSGLLGAAMVATGLLLWARKRRTQLRGAPAPRSLRFVERGNLGIIVGLPLGVAAYFWANRLLPLGMEDRAAWEMHCLFLTWGLSFAHAGARELRRAWREQIALLAALFLLLPLLNAATTHVHLANTLLAGDWVRAGFDLTALAFGLALCYVWRKLTPPAPRQRDTEPRPLARIAAGNAGA